MYTEHELRTLRTIKAPNLLAELFEIFLLIEVKFE